MAAGCVAFYIDYSSGLTFLVLFCVKTKRTKKMCGAFICTFSIFDTHVVFAASIEDIRLERDTRCEKYNSKVNLMSHI